jgi:serine/threonine protein kinase
MIITLELTRATAASLALVFFLAIFGAIYLHKLATRQRCACSLCVAEFRPEQELGFGGFGRVFLVREQATREVFVMKKILTPDLNAANSAQREAKKLRMLSHRLVVGYIVDFLHVEELVAARVVVDPQVFVCIVMENCSNGDLKSFMEKQREGDHDDDDEPSYLEAEWVCRWMHQIATALAYCHAQGVVHRDIKAHNVFLSEDLEIRLGDFGLSRQWIGGGGGGNLAAIAHDNSADGNSSPGGIRRRFNPSASFIAEKGGQSPIRHAAFQSFTTAGTDIYRAPELFSGDSGGFGHDYEKIDMWCCGLVFVELLSLQFTWERPGLVGARALRDGLDFIFEDIPTGYPDAVLSVCRRVLDRNPCARLSASGLKSALEAVFPELGLLDYNDDDDATAADATAADATAADADDC